MKRLTLSLALLTGLCLVTPALAGAPTLGDLLPSIDSFGVGSLLNGIQENPPAPKLDVDVEIGDRDADAGGLPVSPLWLIIGGLAFLLVIALIVMGVRGQSGSATIVHDR